MAAWRKRSGYKIFFFALFVALFSQSYGSLKPSFTFSEREALTRISAHLLIADYRRARLECEEAYAYYPSSNAIRRLFFQTLCKQGEEERALELWKKWKFTPKDCDLIEALAWGILEQAEYSSQWMIPFAAMVSAFETHDARVVAILDKQLRSSNAFLRAIAAKFSAQYWDSGLIERLKILLKKEKVWFVRLEVIGALGAMEVHSVKEELKEIATSSRSPIEEKAAAIHALLAISEKIDEREFRELAGSKRAGMRYLACQFVAHLDWIEKRATIESLLDDSSSYVRIAALNTLYLLGLKGLPTVTLEHIKEMVNDPSPAVAATAAWIALRFAPKVAVAALRKQLYAEDDKTRRLAAFAISHGGEAGLPLALEALKISSDPFVRVNIALGLVENKEYRALACNKLYSFSMLCRKKIMWESAANPLFTLLAPTNLRHVPSTPSYPLMMDQLARLRVFTLLAALNDSRAEDALKSFLSKPILGVSYAAAMALLQEGGEDILIILRKLLEDEHELIRMQAALVLALSGRESSALKTLQESYCHMDRTMKINILQALGHIGSRSSIPFLMEQLEEPYEVLKMVTAAALIRCVYH